MKGRRVRVKTEMLGSFCSEDDLICLCRYCSAWEDLFVKVWNSAGGTIGCSYENKQTSI